MRDTFNYDQHADLHDTDILENPSGTNLWLRQRKEQKIFSFIHVLTKALDASSAPGLTFPQNLGSPQVESQPVGSFTSSMLDIAGERGGVGDEKVVGEHCGSQDTSGEHQHAQVGSRRRTFAFRLQITDSLLRHLDTCLNDSDCLNVKFS